MFGGDALVTAHPLLPGGPRPQFLPGFFSEDETEMGRSLEVMGGLAADILVPGHGPVDCRSLEVIAGDVLRIVAAK